MAVKDYSMAGRFTKKGPFHATADFIRDDGSRWVVKACGGPEKNPQTVQLYDYRFAYNRRSVCQHIACQQRFAEWAERDQLRPTHG